MIGTILSTHHPMEIVAVNLCHHKDDGDFTAAVLNHAWRLLGGTRDAVRAFDSNTYVTWLLLKQFFPQGEELR